MLKDGGKHSKAQVGALQFFGIFRAFSFLFHQLFGVGLILHLRWVHLAIYLLIKRRTDNVLSL